MDELQDGVCPRCGGWCLLTDDGCIAEHAAASGICPGSGKWPSSGDPIVQDPPRPPLHKRPATWGWAALVAALAAVVVIPAHLSAQGEREKLQIEAGVAFVCDQYRDAVAAGHGPVSLSPPVELAGEGFDVNDPATASAVTRECGDSVDAFFGAGQVTRPTPSVDTSIHDALVAAGVAGQPSRALAVVARETGYIWKSRPPTDEEVETFALIAVLECRDVASGERTWQDSAEEALSTGATISEARTISTYLEATFCPQVR